MEGKHAQKAMEAEQTRALKVAEERAVAARVEADPDYDPSMTAGLDSADIMIPKLLLMQAASELVGKELVAAGDMINSVSKDVVVPKGQRIELIPLSIFKTIDVSRKKIGDSKAKAEYLETLPFTGETALLPREEEMQFDDGKFLIKRVHCINLYALRRDEITDPSAFPLVVKFKMSSYKTGKAISNHFAKCQMMRKVPWHCSLILGTDKETKDTNTYFIFTVRNGTNFVRGQDDVVYSTAGMWSKIVNSNKVRVDASEETESSESTDVNNAVV